jgi:long-chain acyl-CoA synthetase
MPLPGTEVKLVPLEDAVASVSLPGAKTPVTVKEGEICLRGPQIMKGYWQRPAENIVDSEGWLHTGDIGRMDDDGYFSIVGRTKDMIIVSGLNVFPRKVEEALLKHPAIADAAVIGAKDKTQGESVKAIIVLREGKTVTDAELNTFLRQHVAAYEVPRIVERRDALPLTLIGKPDKKILKKEQAEAEAAAEEKLKQAKKNGGPQI